MNEVVVVNDKDEIIGTMSRELSHINGTPHRIVVIYVENCKGEILIQVRANTYTLDHSAAGHVDPGEEYLDAAKRELKEELGVDNVNLKFISKAFSETISPEKNQHRAHHMSIFSCVADPKELQKEEVASVYWSDPKKILLEMMENPSDKKYSRCFRVSLPIYLNSKKTV